MGSRGNNSFGAIRSGSLLHMDEEIDTAFQEAYKDEHPEDTNDDRELQQIATLEQHPGWQILREDFLKRIEEYRSGRIIGAELANYTLSDAQIGQLTRNMLLIAGELTEVLNKVTLAVSEVERRKEENRNATQRKPMGSRANRKG
jgi:hypothetical protein